jgi:chromosome segregation ATPase
MSIETVLFGAAGMAVWFVCLIVHLSEQVRVLKVKLGVAEGEAAKFAAAIEDLDRQLADAHGVGASLRNQVLQVRQSVFEEYKDRLAFAEQERGVATEQLARLESECAAAAAEREQSAARTAGVMLDLTHKLEHAEQTIKEATDRAVRDHQGLTEHRRDLLLLRTRLAAAERDRDTYRARWVAAAEAAVDASTACRLQAFSMEGVRRAAGALSDAVVAVGQAPSDFDADRAERAARQSLADVLPPDADSLEGCLPLKEPVLP